MGVANLWPRTFDGPNGKVDSGGEQLRKLIFSPSQLCQAMRIAHHSQRALTAYNEGKWNEARRIAKSALTTFPESLDLQNFIGICALCEQDFEQARDLFVELL